MQSVIIDIPYNYKDTFKLYPFGDLHYGTKHCSEDKAREKIREIASEKNSFWVGMGDMGEFITPSDPRWDFGVIKDVVKPDNIAYELERGIVNILSPIKNTCLGMMEGNHEEAIRRHNHNDVHANICEKLGVTNLGFSSFIKLRFKRNNSNEVHDIDCFFTHGAGWAITAGSKMNRLLRMMHSFHATIYGVGHMHDIIISPDVPYLTTNDAGKIVQKVKKGAITGSWFTTYTEGAEASYGERRNYPPTSIGCPVFIIKPQTQNVSAVSE